MIWKAAQPERPSDLELKNILLLRIVMVKHDITKRFMIVQSRILPVASGDRVALLE
jgi:hypothetical protein